MVANNMRFMPSPPENPFTFPMPRADKFWVEYVNEINTIVSQRNALLPTKA